MFVSVFTETVDWEDGDDPQEFSVLPLTPDEATELLRLGEIVTEQHLEGIGQERRCFAMDNPKGGKATVFWRYGLFVGRHW